MSQYGNDNEVDIIRVGAKTFEWHLASEAAYAWTTIEQEMSTYYFAYDYAETYYSAENDVPEDATLVYSYTYEYPKVSTYYFAYDYESTYYHDINDVPAGHELAYSYSYEYFSQNDSLLKSLHLVLGCLIPF